MALVYDQPTESLGSGVSSPTTQNEGAAAMQRGGKALVQAGVTANSIVMDYHNTIDTAVAKEMDNRFSDTLRTILTDPEHGYLNTKGEDAMKARGAAENRRGLAANQRTRHPASGCVPRQRSGSQG